MGDESGQMIRLALVLAAFLLAPHTLNAQTIGSPPAPSPQQAERDAHAQAERFAANVVRVLTRTNDGQRGPEGFGLIIGTRGADLIVVTANHVAFGRQGGLTDRPSIRFIDEPGRDVPAERQGPPHADLPQYDDLAVLLVHGAAARAPPPAPAAILRQSSDGGAWVWTIGRGNTWIVSGGHGGFVGFDDSPLRLIFDAVGVVEGMSGGALVTQDGIAGMILADGSGGLESYALPIARLLERLRGWHYPTNLLVDAAPGQAVATPVPASPSPGAAPRRAGDRFRDCATCPELVVIPAGSFMMGSPAGEAGRDDDEQQHGPITIPSFASGRTVVTFAEWDACVLAGGCGGYHPADRGWGREQRPVINVSWNDAQAYVKWLSGQTGQRYRLLTEAEWEYAARAGTTTPFSTGAGITPEQAQYDWTQNLEGWPTRSSGPTGTAPVGTFPANAFGLQDMNGNVWEWVEDCHQNDYRSAPTDGRAVTLCEATDPRGATYLPRVLRGGSWYDPPRSLRSASRYRNFHDERDNYIGFRVARAL